MKQAVLTDLMGTLILTRNGSPFPKDHADWRFNERVFAFLEGEQRDGRSVFVISNQAGIRSGHYSADTFHRMRHSILADARHRGLHIKDFIYAKDKDFMRKPHIGMALFLAGKHNVEFACYVGDQKDDEHMAQAMGIPFVNARDL